MMKKLVLVSVLPLLLWAVVGWDSNQGGASGGAPSAHAESHRDGGDDEVATATPGAGAIPKADGASKLAAAWFSGVLASTGLTDVSLTGAAANDLFVRNGSSQWVNGTMSGDGTVGLSGNTLTLTIANDAVTSAKVLNGELVAGDFATATVNRLNPTPAAAGNIPVDAGAATPYSVIDGSDADTTKALFATGPAAAPALRVIAAGDIDELLTVEQLVDVTLAGLAEHNMLVRNGSNAWVNAAVTGDVTWTLSGNTLTTAIAGSSIVLADLAAALQSPAQGTEGTRKISTSAAAALATAAAAGSSVQASAADHVHAAPSVSENTTAHGATTLLRLNGVSLDSSTSAGTTNVTITASAAGSQTGFQALCTTATVVNMLATSVTVVNTTGDTLTFSNVNENATITTSGASGLDTGSENSSTWYHLWWIAKTDGTAIDALLSTSATAPTMPSGYTYKLHSGCTVRNEADSDFLFFFQQGNDVIVSQSDTNEVATSVSGGPTNADCSAYVSPLARIVKLDMILTTTDTGVATVSATLSHPSLTFASSTFAYTLDGGSGTSPTVRVPVEAVCSSAQLVAYTVSTNDTLTLRVRGYTNRGN